MRVLVRVLIWASLAAFIVRVSLPLEELGGTSVNLGSQNNVARKIDEYEFLPTDDEAARLDAFSEALRKQPNVRGYIVGYNEPRETPGVFLRRIYGDRRYLTEARGLELGRIVVVNGGYKEKRIIELWLVPYGAMPPVPAPTLPQIQPNNRAPYIFDEECLECSPAVNLDLYGLEEGLKFYAEALSESPNSKGLIVVRSGEHVGTRKALNDARRAKKLLARNHNINADRIVIQVGRRRKDNTAVAEMWVVPRGARFPMSTRKISCNRSPLKEPLVGTEDCWNVAFNHL